jgi:hypothetical protein
MTRARVALGLCAAALLLAPRVAEAAEPHRHALSLHPLAFLQRGVELQYEHFVAPPRFSVATKLGYRDGASEDFDATQLTSALEGRYWLDGRKVRDMTRLFIYFRLDASTTAVWNQRDGRSLGSTMTFAPVFGGGYRFVLFDWLEVTPTAGLGMAADVDARGRLPVWWRTIGVLGLTAGVMWR